MSKIEALLDRIIDGMRIIGAACLVGMTMLTCIDVVGRFFSRPIFGSVEIVGFLATLTIALSLPYTHHMRGHIGVEIIVRLFPARIQTVIEVVTGVLGLFLFSLVTWRMFVYAGTMRASGEVSMNLQFPEYTIIYAASFCFLVFTLEILRDIIGNLRSVLRGDL